MVSLDQLKKIIPYAGPKAGFFLPPLNAAMDEFGINTPLRVSAFLAQIAVESGSFRYVREIADGKAYEGRIGLGNTQPGDGPRFKGRGLIQITGRANYQACGQALGLDLIASPELLELPEHAARSAGWFWSVNGLNKWADAGDIDGVSDMVNRGKKTAAYGDALLFKDRYAVYQRALPVLSA